jgi:GGDEF domain-containing protein
MWTQIRRLFSSDVQEGTPGAGTVQRQARATPYPHPEHPVGGAAGNADIEAKIGAILAHRPDDTKLVGGKINLLNLEEIKRRLGPKWPRHEEQVHQFVARTLERRLTDKDFFTRSDQDTYLILFHDVSEAEAKLKCALLGKEISDHFFGELANESGEGLQVETVFASVDGSLARQGVSLSDAIGKALAKAEVEAAQTPRPDTGSLTVREIEELLGMTEGRFEEIDKADPDNDGPILVQNRYQELIRQLTNIEDVLAAEDQAWKPLAGQNRQARKLAVTWDGQQVSPAHIIHKFIERADGAIERSRAAAARDSGSKRGDEPPLELETSYLPMWSVAQQRIGLYLCQTRIIVNARQLESGLNQNDEAGIKIIDAVDRISLRRARVDLRTITSKGLSCIVVIPVHFDTLSRPASAQRYLPVCHAIPRELRQLIVWEIRGAPLIKWTTNFTRIVEQLRPLGRAVFTLAHPMDLPAAQLPRTVAKLHSIGVHGIGLDLSCDAEPESQTMAYLNRFAEAAESHKLMTYLHGVNSLSLSTAATCSGISHLSGNTISPPIQSPDGVQPKALVSLYQHSESKTLAVAG